MLNIKTLREKSGYTQSYLAQQIDVSRPTWAQIEKGEHELTISEAEKLAGLFNMTLAQLLGITPQTQTEVILSKQKDDQAAGVKITVPSDKVKKFKEILLYIFCKIGAQPNFGQTVLYKLLYFIDFDYYEKYGEKLIGATYIKNHYGPTPVEFKAVISEMEKEKTIEVLKSKYFKYQQKKYLPLRRPDLKCISGTEKDFIDSTLTRLSDKNAKELSEYSHGDVPWKISKMGKKIGYKLVYEREKPYTPIDYNEAFSIMFLRETEKRLPPMTDEEIEYYKGIREKYEKRNRNR